LPLKAISIDIFFFNKFNIYYRSVPEKKGAGKRVDKMKQRIFASYLIFSMAMILFPLDASLSAASKATVSTARAP
jgi:hypothetical protein